MGIDGPLGEIFPRTLRNETWQKQKSFLDKAKSKTKTGLGAELIKLEAAWKKIDWNVMDARMQGKWPSIEKLQEAKKKAQVYYRTNIPGLYNVLRAVARKAETTATNAGLSKTAKAAATAIAKEATAFAQLTMGITFEDFDEEEARIKKGWAVWRARLPKNVADLEAKLKQLEKDPRTAYWSEIDVTNAFRSVGNTLGNNPEFKDLWPKPWADFDGLQNTRHPKLAGLKNDTKEATPEERKAILELINEVKPHLKKLKSRL